ncbi:FKBP-type peptidyl-prolyl cis-trans isomerase [Larsenimonas suaedae]|uniref:Peptidyl-prolyl cis-trans isomerase n=1 Tax=Larsenimonas suaedae TaxID=1851019 RepID=A0ABU1GYP8_9GAMM|nr:FKBP-type peptidyl-prolyl cis-trans isomerase [Larsenimonas suaedae]MCM2973702.1 FKBP-type peptidyl-prolyl cis-trans isomerase [Larsenimonas suaedae]MDR5897164.1 FKBP-type peptidyl-prolyl cis-trans isomerase [Larsenimonas suaedae]
MSSYTVDEGMQITLHFSLLLEDGTEVDSTREQAPAVFVYGDGNLPPGFERAIKGLGVGESGQFAITPEHAFGQYNPQNVQQLKREDFDQSIELEEGLVVSFADPAGGGELPGVIKSMDGDRVEVDFNHPLAGRTLTFDVDILDIVPATTH